MNFINLKKDFPIFKNIPDLVYLDSTATSLKPKAVVDKLVEYYSNYSANIFRGVYKISEKATEEFEETREVTAKFINALKSEEVIFTRNSTESMNLIAYSLGRKIVSQKDEVVTTIMEHHSNFVPWQVLCSETGADFKIVDIDNNGYLDLGMENLKFKSSNLKSKSRILNLQNIVTRRTKILALTYVSNVLGTINPIKQLIEAAKRINPNIITIVDAAQAVPHLKADVQDLGCDFLVFSSHKMLGPTGVGVLWGKEDLLKEMFPFMYGGEMINGVYIDHTIYKDPPHKFEAGTPAIGEVIAFKEAVKYLKAIGMDKVREHEKNLTSLCFNKLNNNFSGKIKIFGPSDVNDRGGVVAFKFGNYHPHDIASIFDESNIASRAGNHCAMPLHTKLGVNATIRVSFYIYNDGSDIEKLVDGLKRVEKVLS